MAHMAYSSTSSVVQNNNDSSPRSASFTGSDSMPEASVIDDKEEDDMQSQATAITVPTSLKYAMDITAQKVASHRGAFCDTCSALLAKPIDYFNHIRGRRHLLAMKYMLIKNPQYKQPTYEELCQKREELQMPIFESKRFVCHLCNVMRTSQAAFDAHINGKEHQDNANRNSQLNTTISDPVVENNPSLSNNCDVPSVQSTLKTDLDELLARRRDQQRVKDEEYCTKEATAMNINFNEYEIPSTDDKKEEFVYECTKCNTKFRSKMHLIGHLKSAAHAQKSKLVPHEQTSKTEQGFNRSVEQNDSAITRRTILTSRGSHQPVTGARPPYRSQAHLSSQANNQTDSSETSTNIFGAFDPDNLYSVKRPASLMENSTSYNQPYPKRMRTHTNNHKTHSSQYSYKPSTFPNQSSNSQTYPSLTANFNNPPAASNPPAAHYETPYHHQYSDSYLAPTYDSSMNYTYVQPPLPNYESSYPPVHSTSSIPVASYIYYSYYYPGDQMSDQGYYSYPQQPFSY